MGFGRRIAAAVAALTFIAGILPALQAQPVSAPEAISAPIADDAVVLFKRYEPAMYQIRVVDLTSGEKSSIGSGFAFSPDGNVATNFHVIAEAVHKPRRFRVEAVHPDGTVSALRIVHFDVVQDVAIVQDERPQNVFIPLGSSDLSKGARLFSLGNPHDLGTVIVEGTYNGLIEKTLYRKILFSGSINPGMSGGPTIDENGRVVGVNVSTAGNELSFLVPVERLQHLLAELDGRSEADAPGWQRLIGEQLLANQRYFFQTVFDAEWQKTDIGQAHVPSELTNTFKCWGDSEDEKVYVEARLSCFTEDEVFVSRKFQTGQMAFEYLWLESTGLNTLQFYQLVQQNAAVDSFANAQKDDVTNFDTESGFIWLGGRDWKIVLSARRYKKYPELYDVAISVLSVSEPKNALLLSIKALGVEKENGLRLARRFLEEIQWPNS